MCRTFAPPLAAESWSREMLLPACNVSIVYIVFTTLGSAFPAGFLRKVYGILTAQLVLTVLVVLVCIAVPSCKTLVQGR